ncbi:hypothetical protein [Natrinema sp. SYSU A 869]|uniref:hypothetical protein n=1 Tax=Natrinema sp. SYSU A 869 TaxID=2871694 RepID=UPI001CA3E518|nr:hypothetical protein [Natrinema sp. SYSU A 869]
MTVDTKARVATNKISNSSLNLTNNDSTVNTTRQIGHFALEFDEYSKGYLEIATEDDNVEFNYDNDDNKYVVEGCDFKPPARVDLVSGEINGTDCDPELIYLNESYDELNFSKNSGVSGSYELVVKGGNSISVDNHDGAWDVLVDITYESSHISYTRSVQIPIYERER